MLNHVTTDIMIDILYLGHVDGAELCDCTLGTLSHCSTLRDDHEYACGENSAPSQSLSLLLSIPILLSAVLYK